MATPIQIVFDCTDPDRLAKFWAAALHCTEEAPPTGYASWTDFLKAQGIPEEEWNTRSAVVDPANVGPRIYFQQMDTPKPTKNRVHLDINISGGRGVSHEERVARVNAEVERILKLGATKQRAWEESGEYWVVLQDPEGNEFCVQ